MTCPTHAEAMAEIDARAFELAAEVGEKIAEAMDSISERHEDMASGLTLATHTLGEVACNLAVTALVAMRLPKPKAEAAYDEFLSISLKQIEEFAASRRSRNLASMAKLIEEEEAKS